MTEPDNGPLFERAVRDPAARTTMHADALLPVEHTRDPDQMLTALMTAAAEAFGEFTPDALVVGRPTIVRHDGQTMARFPLTLAPNGMTRCPRCQGWAVVDNEEAR